MFIIQRNHRVNNFSLFLYTSFISPTYASKLTFSSSACYVHSGYWISLLSAISSPLQFFVNFVFLLTFLNTVLPSIYTSPLGRLYAVQYFLPLIYPLCVTFTKASFLEKFQLPLSDVMYKFPFCFYCFFVVTYMVSPLYIQHPSVYPYFNMNCPSCARTHTCTHVCVCMFMDACMHMCGVLLMS